MDNAVQHWKILQQVRTDFLERVRSFMVIGMEGDGLLMITDDGEGYWFGQMKFGWNKVVEMREAPKPTRLSVSDLTIMAHGRNHIVLLNRRGQIYTIGKNYCKQLGLEGFNRQTHYTPQLLFSLSKFVDVRCGCGHSLALTDDGKVWAWGANDSGQIGVPSTTTANSLLRHISQIDSHRAVAIECGGQHSLALTDQGDVYAWGWNQYGQLGHDDFDKGGQEKQKYIPIRMNSPCAIKSIAAGHSHTLLLTKNNEVFACGLNDSGQLSFQQATNSTFIFLKGICLKSLTKVTGLPPISQIASHFDTHLSIAFSYDCECFVWGKLIDKTNITIPLKLSSIYSTIDSAFSFISSPHNTPHSIRVQQDEKHHQRIDSMKNLKTLQFTSNRLANQMFDNPNSKPDVQFVIGDKTILAHRWVLEISSDYFKKLFSDLISLAGKSSTTTTSTETDSPISDPNNIEPKIVPITITPYSYAVFYAYLYFLYTETLQVSPENIIEFFGLASNYQESELMERCLEWMRESLTIENCCRFYELTDIHLLPEFKQELVQFISTNLLEVYLTTAYQSMEGDLCKELAISIANFCQSEAIQSKSTYRLPSDL